MLRTHMSADPPPPKTTIVDDDPSGKDTRGDQVLIGSPAPADPPTLPPGERLEHYLIQRELGRGGMGVVYEAVDERLGRRVALKVLPAEVAIDSRARERLVCEARLQASIDHPGIAVIHALEQTPKATFLAMQFIEGTSLDILIGDGTCPTWTLDERLRIARRIASALAAAHAGGVIHCDLKPGNIILSATPDGLAPRVVDFGIARALAQREGGQRWASSDGEPGTLVGTPGYMSPEQIEGERVDERADIWAFGCLLYELLTCERAFKGHTVLQALDATINRRPDWSALPDQVPVEVVSLIRRCLVTDERFRLSTMAEARDILLEAEGAAASTRRWSETQKRAARRAVGPGDPAPGFVLTSADGESVASADLLARGPLVVVFYRGVW